MSESTFAPFLASFLMVMRCLIPIVALAVLAYFIRKSGLAVIEKPEDPNEDEMDAEAQDGKNT